MEADLFAEINEDVVETSQKLTYTKDVPATNCSIEEILKSWNLLHLSDFFKDQNIDTTVLTLIGHEDLYELLPKMKFGDRVIFKHHYMKWRGDFESPMPPFKSLSFSQSTISPKNHQIVQKIWKPMYSRY
ncbi:uncharacterized protein [Musca autumnalis]|uniref:uncharacterized protein n=1 Tax=Musca autumnalis TaxID=221902 RepID=UPI003CEDEACA